MSLRLLVVACAFQPACSFAFVNDPQPEALADRRVPLGCTSSRAMPIADMAIGVLLGAAVAGITYAFVEEANESCPAS